LEDVFEDVTAFGRVPQHLVVQAVIRVIGLAHLLRTSNFRKLQFVAIIE